MFTISIQTGFNAPHQLTFADGSKEPLHSHDWVVVAEVSAEKLNNIGLVMDFHHLKGMLDAILTELQGDGLGKMKYFKLNSPSAENVARYVYEKLEPMLPKGVKLEAVIVTEEAGCKAKFAK